jgi:hypothetical protein
MVARGRKGRKEPLLKLSDPRVARKTRFGHCRGAEPVDYVQDIDERYTAYVQLLPASKSAESD